jgi:competence protein ComEC
MFSCIALADGFARRTSIYNSLAFSAVALLCYNPYWLWDAGFQLSYAAVLSIVIFNGPVYKSLYFKNKLLDLAWKMNAVTLAAQILTIPVCIYHFHQFPNYFLLTNFVAVPLSSLILMAEIVLCCINFIPFVAMMIGRLTGWLIRMMNWYIETIESFPFALWNDLKISLAQAVALTVIIVGFSKWMTDRSQVALKLAVISLTIFLGLRSISFFFAAKQRKLIIYNIPQHQAIDIMHGREVYFIGDSAIASDDAIKNFHLRPSRILYRVQPSPTRFLLKKGTNYFTYGSLKILLINETSWFAAAANKQQVDLLILSGNTRLYITRLIQTFTPKLIVFDGSVADHRLKYWRKDCDSLKIPWYDVSLQGAFEMNVN